MPFKSSSRAAYIRYVFINRNDFNIEDCIGIIIVIINCSCFFQLDFLLVSYNSICTARTIAYVYYLNDYTKRESRIKIYMILLDTQRASYSCRKNFPFFFFFKRASIDNHEKCSQARECKLAVKIKTL